MRKFVLLAFFSHVCVLSLKATTPVQRALLAVRGHAQRRLRQEVDERLTFHLRILAKEEGLSRPAFEEKFFFPYSRTAIYEEVVFRLGEGHGLEPERALESLAQLDEVVVTLLRELHRFPAKAIVRSHYGLDQIPSKKWRDSGYYNGTRDKFIKRVLANFTRELASLLPRYGISESDFWHQYAESDLLEAFGKTLERWESIPLGDLGAPYEAQAFCERALRILLERLAHWKGVPFPADWRKELESGVTDRQSLYHRLSLAEREILHSLWDISPATQQQRSAFQAYFVEMSPLRIGYTDQTRTNARMAAISGFDLFISFRDWIYAAPTLAGQGDDVRSYFFRLKKCIEQLGITYRISSRELPLIQAFALLEERYRKSGARFSIGEWKQAIEESARQALSEHVKGQAFHDPFDPVRTGKRKVISFLVIRPVDLHFSDVQWKMILWDLENYQKEIASQFGFEKENFFRRSPIGLIERGLFTPEDFVAAVQKEQTLWEERRLGRTMPPRGIRPSGPPSLYDGEVRLIVKNAIRRLCGRAFQKRHGHLPEHWQVLNRSTVIAMLPQKEFERVLSAWALREVVRGRAVSSVEGDVVTTRMERFRDLFVHNVADERFGQERLSFLYHEPPEKNWKKILGTEFESFMRVWEALHLKKHYFANAQPEPGRVRAYLVLWARLQRETDRRLEDIESVFDLDHEEPLIAYGEFKAFVDRMYASPGAPPENPGGARQRAETMSREFINSYRPKRLIIKGSQGEFIELSEFCPLTLLDLVYAFSDLRALVEERAQAFGLSAFDFWDKNGSGFNYQDILDSMLSIATDWRARRLGQAQGKEQLRWLARASIDRLLATLWFSKQPPSEAPDLADWQSDLLHGDTDRFALVLRIPFSDLRVYLHALTNPSEVKLAERFLDTYFYLGVSANVSRKHPGAELPTMADAVDGFADRVLQHFAGQDGDAGVKGHHFEEISCRDVFARGA